MFVVENGVAHKRSCRVKGEVEGNLFLETELQPGSQVVSEGRALLSDQDRVQATAEPAPSVAGTGAGTKP